MAGLTLAAADAALKDFYEPAVREQLNQDCPMTSWMDANSSDIEGRQAVLSVHTGRNSGVGARKEGGNLPLAGNQGYNNPKIPLRFNYSSIQLSGPVIEGMKTDRGSFVRAIKSEMDGATHDLKRDYNRQIWGTADGIIMQCGVTTAATTINLAAGATAVQSAQLEVGMSIDFGTSADPPVLVGAAGTGQGMFITSITGSPVATSITVSATPGGASVALTTAATTFIYRAGAGGQNVSQAELTGLQAIVGTGAPTGMTTLFNINPTTTPIWKSYVSAATGALSLNVMAKAEQTIQRNGGAYPNIIVGDDGVYRAYANLLTPLQRYNDTTTLKGGYSSLPFVAGGPNVPVVWDRDCPSGFLLFLNSDHLIQFQSADWHFVDYDGAVLARVTGSPGQDAYQGTLAKYSEVATDKRNALGSLSGVTGA